MNFLNQLSSLFWLVVSVVIIYVESTQDIIGTITNPGPGFFPFWGGILLGVFSIILFAKSSLTKGRRNHLIPLWAGKKWSNVIWVVSALLLYTLLISKAGYIISTFGLMTLLFGLLDKSKFWVKGLWALLVTITTYLLFSTLLDIQLPRGVLDF